MTRDQVDEIRSLLAGAVDNANFYKPETPHYHMVEVPLQWLRNVREADARLQDFAAMTPAPPQDSGNRT